MTVFVEGRPAIPVAEAATRLRMTRERLVRRVQQGTIAGLQLGDRWFVWEDAVQEVEDSAAAPQG